MKNKSDKLRVASFHHAINHFIRNAQGKRSSLEVTKSDNELLFVLSQDEVKQGKKLRIKLIDSAEIACKALENETILLPDPRKITIKCKGGSHHTIALNGSGQSKSRIEKAPYEKIARLQ